ncbi:galactosylceramide sulfotransferase-like [Saccoglossus kowalevskii]|uniref:Galactosylceramide sulfotransferase-like n=1 Tax=Saccoglossus kowalevskii TaxID=10224 RepID=A0ABM0LUD7_SACKO|nr:PREDICTED: galactosylceramide sulfotransferase-like [Saccoglossus kowalevskii]
MKSVAIKTVLVIALLGLCIHLQKYYLTYSRIGSRPSDVRVSDLEKSSKGNKNNTIVFTNRKQTVTCKQMNFVFVKTYKTGSSTVGSTLFRYGLKNNLISAIALQPASMIVEIINNTAGVRKYDCDPTFPGYNYLVSHVKHYNYNVLNTLVKRAQFITLLRSPFKHLESSFYYFHADVACKLLKHENPFAEFVTHLQNYTDPTKMKAQLRNRLHNGQLYGLGCDDDNCNDQTSVVKKNNEIEQQFDLVMITDYMDESMVLLKQLMCWRDDDVVYKSMKVVGNNRPPITEHMKGIISKWNKADMQLYNHFNRTFWRRIKNYKGDFDSDLQSFRTKQTEKTEMCVKTKRNNEDCKWLEMDVTQLRTTALKIQAETICKKQNKNQ